MSVDSLNALFVDELKDCPAHGQRASRWSRL